MTEFVWNILLAFFWVFMTGHLTPENLLIGFALGYVTLLLSHRIRGISSYHLKVLQLPRFLLFFVWALIRANLRVAHDVVTPTHYMKPGIVAIPLDVRGAGAITLLANLVSLTPGTLSLDVSHDQKVLYIHSMYIDNPEQVRREIKDGFERRVLEVLR